MKSIADMHGEYYYFYFKWEKKICGQRVCSVICLSLYRKLTAITELKLKCPELLKII